MLDNTSTTTYEFSKSLQGPVMEMVLRGVLVDQGRRAKVLKEFKAEIERLTYQFNRICEEGIGVQCQWSSHAQLKKLLYNVMKLPPVRKRNANGVMAPTSNRDALEKLSSYLRARPVCEHVLKLRELDKKRQFLEASIDDDGRMRTSYNIAGTNSGRLSSSISDLGTGGNMQNVDRKIRYTFIADPGMKFANLDLEQADARNVGAIIWNQFYASHGEAFAGSYLNAVESGDLHTYVCKLVWPGLAWTGDPVKDRQIADQIFYRGDSYRDLAKKGGHGTNYYGTPHTMAKHLKVDKLIIEDFQRPYFKAFPCIGNFKHEKKPARKRDGTYRTPENWHDYVYLQLETVRYITTFHFNRRRYFWGRRKDDKTLREAIAYEPQSMTADEIDTGIMALWRDHRVQLLIQVHDNILFQYREEEEDEIIPWAIEKLRVPMILAGDREFCVPVEAKVGWNWGDQVKDKNGNVESNPDGLIKWTGQDKRIRTEKPLRGLQSILRAS